MSPLTKVLSFHTDVHKENKLFQDFLFQDKSIEKIWEMKSDILLS